MKTKNRVVVSITMMKMEVFFALLLSYILRRGNVEIWIELDNNFEWLDKNIDWLDSNID